MRLVCLNAWGGRRFTALTGFVRAQRRETDVFCFQEVHDTAADRRRAGFDRANLLDELVRLLPEFEHVYEPTQRGYDNQGGRHDFPLTIGQATFVRRPVRIVGTRVDYVFGEAFGMKGNDFATAGRAVLTTTVRAGRKRYVIGNLHGLWNRNYRRDDPDRLEQSRNLRRVMDGWERPALLCGDFNLNPDTRSFGMLADGWRDLVLDFGITDTRGRLFPYDERYCDYVLTTPDVDVRRFAVPRVAVSDHLPLVVEFA